MFTKFNSRLNEVLSKSIQKRIILHYCNLIRGIYYIYRDLRLGYQLWHRPLKIANTVYKREKASQRFGFESHEFCSGILCATAKVAS